MGQIVLSRLTLSNDISKFLVDSNDARLSWISRQLAESELTRTTILVVGAKDQDRALDAAGALADELQDDPEVASVRHGWDPTLSQTFRELYFPRRFLFAAEDPATLDERLSDAGL